MKVTKGYKTELDPTPEQYTLFCQCAGVARYAYNYGLSRKQEAYKHHEKTPYALQLQKELTARKHDDLPWLSDVSKWIVQNALRHLDEAFERFFEKCKRKKLGKWKGKCGYPRYKSKHKGRGSFRLDTPVYVYADAVQLPKIGRVRLKEHDYIPTWGVKVLSATVSEQAGRWFVSVQVQYETSEPTQAMGEPLGIDLGIKTLATLSDGRTFANPKALHSNLKRLRRLSRSHSRKVKGSNNRKKATRRLARQHARIANIRRDALHKATSSIVAKTKPDAQRPMCIVLEDLHIQGMLKNRKLSRALSDVGMYAFKRQLMYKAAMAGVQVKEVSRWYPSSKTCSSCGTLRDELGLDERVFVCLDCGYVAERDYNAARVLARAA